MPGVFSPDKERFYADAGEFLVAIKYQGRTRYLQLSAQLVGHDEDFMGKVETDVPAIRNGLSIFFTQQDFSAVSTLEGRETLRLATLVEINKIIGATAELRVADVYFTDYNSIGILMSNDASKDEILSSEEIEALVERAGESGFDDGEFRAHDFSGGQSLSMSKWTGLNQLVEKHAEAMQGILSSEFEFRLR